MGLGLREPFANLSFLNHQQDRQFSCEYFFLSLGYTKKPYTRFDFREYGFFTPKLIGKIYEAVLGCLRLAFLCGKSQMSFYDSLSVSVGKSDYDMHRYGNEQHKAGKADHGIVIAAEQAIPKL